MLRRILALISLVGLMVIGLLVYSMTTSVDEMEQTATGYQQGLKQQLVTKTKEIAGPTLAKFGIDVEKTQPEDLNIVKQSLEDAAQAVNDATKALGGSK